MIILKDVVAGSGDLIIVRDLLVRNIIGVDNWERQKKQDVIINLRMESDVSAAGESDEIDKTISYSAVAKEVAEFAETKQYKRYPSSFHLLYSLPFTLSSGWERCRVMWCGQWWW